MFLIIHEYYFDELVLKNKNDDKTKIYFKK